MNLQLCKSKYSQDPISGRPISGKSRYPDRFEFGYRSLSVVGFDFVAWEKRQDIFYYSDRPKTRLVWYSDHGEVS